MSVEMYWVAVTKDRDKILKLRDYVNELNNRDYTMEYHEVYTYGTTVYQDYDNYFLVGQWRNCMGYDLGYFANIDGKNDLLEDILYFEGVESDSRILFYCLDEKDSSYMLGRAERVGDRYEGPETDNLRIVELWPWISQALAYGKLNENIKVE